MFATVNATIYAPGQWEAGQAQREEFWALLAAQPGARGAIRVDTGASRVLNLLVWEQEAQWVASRPVMEPAGARLMIPLFATPLQQLGMGEVVRNTLTAGAAPGYARLVEATWGPGQWVAGQAARDELLALQMQQSGCRGSLSVDIGADQRLLLQCWDSAAQYEAAQAVLGPATVRLIRPFLTHAIGKHLTAPGRIHGEGAVVYDSLTPRA